MAKKITALEMFYDIRSGKYPTRIGERFVPLSSGDAEIHLRATGISKDNWIDGLRETERTFLVCQQERGVDYSAPLAGHLPGPLELPDGSRILITSSPRLPVAKRGQWKFIRNYLDELLDGQAEHFMGWLQCAVVSLERRDFRPGQMYAFAGKSNCGKSLLQWIVSQCFGGRQADPLLWLRGSTKFNEDLAMAEHWAIEDPGNSSRSDVRRDFGDAIKRAVINRTIQVHGKGKTGYTVPVWRRVTMSLNDEEENITALPIMDDSMKDKVCLAKCGVATLPDDPLLIQRRVLEELPAFLFAVRQLEIPKALRCSRMGIQSWHHPDIMAALTTMSVEQQMLNLIDEHVFANANKLTGPWIGSAEKLKTELINSPFGFTAQKLLSFSSACGVYLARLAKRFPERITCTAKNGKTVWTIHHGAND